jgi:hypothetical protein
VGAERRRSESARQRILDYFLERGVGVVVDKAELMKVARISDWARRVRELRDEYGWQISSFNDRGDLRPGQYVLESREQRPASRRRVPSDQRARILNRDGYTCQVCGLGAGDPDPGDADRRVRLHIDHVVPISAGGSNEDDNLRTICSVCNEGRSNLFNPADDRATNILSVVRRQPRDVQLQVYRFLRVKFERDPPVQSGTTPRA